MINKKRSISSNYWLKEHFNDKYVQHAKKKGLRSRACFKLEELHISDNLFKPGIIVVDLGSSPGSWSQYAMKQISPNGRIIACDRVAMNPIIGVDFLQGDFCDEIVYKVLMEIIGQQKVQVLMSDMAPNITGIPNVDIPKSIYLAERALSMCLDILEPYGSFVVKIFQGDGFDEYLRKVRSFFTKIKIRKPEASRLRSREVYIVATNRKL